jgi:hypothetical protein
MPSTTSDPVFEPSPETALLERLESLPQWANHDDALLHRGRFVSLQFQIVIGSTSCFVSLSNGKVERIEKGPQRMRSSTFIVSASAVAWEKFWQPTPEPWWHDLFAMNKKGNLTIEGDLHPFMANLQYFKDLLALPRRMPRTR